MALAIATGAGPWSPWIPKSLVSSRSCATGHGQIMVMMANMFLVTVYGLIVFNYIFEHIRDANKNICIMRVT